MKPLTLLTAAFILISCSCKQKEPTYQAPVQQEPAAPVYVPPSSSSDNSGTTYQSGQQDNDGPFEDGIYCASVDYYNPNTGNSSSYNLDVEVENGELVRIYFPNGGWLDESHFIAPEIESDGTASFTTDKGYDYEVELVSKGGCSFSSGTNPEVLDEESEEETED